MFFTGKSFVKELIILRCTFPLKCVPYNDYTMINSNDQLDVTGLCLNGCEETNVTYVFSLFRYEQVNGSNEWMLFNQSQYYFFQGESSERLIVTNDLFTNDKIVYLKITLNVFSNTDNEMLHGDSSIIFLINYPPIDGGCSVDPINGTTSQLFTFKCYNWTDFNGINKSSIVKYVYFGSFFR
jgi:hypothetical protein